MVNFLSVPKFPKFPPSSPGVLFSAAPCGLVLYNLVRVRLPDRVKLTVPETC